MISLLEIFNLVNKNEITFSTECAEMGRSRC